MKRKICIVFIVLFIFLVSCSSVQVETVKHDYFEKSMYTFLEFDNEEKDNINSFLEAYYVETDNVSGFSKYESKYDMNLIKYCLELSLNCNDVSSFDTLYEMVFEKLKKINVTQIENGYDLYCYFLLAKEYNLSFGEEFYNLLEYYYDNENSLFLYNGCNDSEEIKLSMTINFYSILKDDEIFVEKYEKDVKNKIETMYNTFEFLEPTANISLYNSGGRILVASNLILGKSNFDDKLEWYNEWKNSIDSITDLLSASSYCDFIDIMSLFEQPDYSMLDNYLKNLNEINLDSDLQCLSKISNYVDITKYDFYLKVKLNEYINGIELIRNNIDIENTFYGYLLSSMTDFNTNLDKLNNIISIYYNMIYNEDSVDKLSHYIYFTVGLDICINHSITCDLDVLLNKINFVLDSEARSIDFRKVIETASAISIFESVTISKDNVDKISNQINEIFSDENNLTYSLVSDLLIMYYEINGTLNAEVYNKLKDNLYCDGGFKSISENSEADIISTYSLYKLNTEISDNKYISENVSFVNSLKVDEGIYTYSLSDNTVNLITIWYGNIIANTKVGEVNNGTKN